MWCPLWYPLVRTGHRCRISVSDPSLKVCGVYGLVYFELHLNLLSKSHNQNDHRQSYASWYICELTTLKTGIPGLHLVCASDRLPGPLHVDSNKIPAVRLPSMTSIYIAEPEHTFSYNLPIDKPLLCRLRAVGFSNYIFHADTS
jgi:hypothetical protein